MNYKMLFLAWITLSGLHAQVAPCLLGTGEDTETIIQVFQLNEQQQAQLQEWSLEVKIRQEDIAERAGGLIEAENGSGTTGLDSLATKYNALKKELLRVQADFDTRVLALFNEKQYQRYIQLCEEVDRAPLAPAEPE